MSAGKRDRLVIFERATVATDAYGGETQTWGEYHRAYAEVRWGTGQERREAAQERASVAATFQVLANSFTRALTPGDRLTLDGVAYDITSAVPNGRAHIDVTGVRSA